MRYLLGCAVAAAIGLVGVAAFAADHDVTLTGCVVRGEGHGFLLTNVPGEAAFERARADKIEPGVVGTSGASQTTFYWLEDDKDLAKEAGHRVELSGEIEGDVKPGEIKIDRKDRWTEVEIKSEGRTLKAQVPQSLFVVSDATSHPDQKVDVLVRRVEPKHVKMLAASCE
jgi:hypothetical protein